jgi:hypothetical protein
MMNSENIPIYSVNLKEGYQLIEIRTPMEVINED